MPSSLFGTISLFVLFSVQSLKSDFNLKAVIMMPLSWSEVLSVPMRHCSFSFQF